MGKLNEATRKFCQVRDAIDKVKHPQAYRIAFKLPLKFYLAHSTEEIISILIDVTEHKSGLGSINTSGVNMPLTPAMAAYKITVEEGE